jgi:hypothetical protein
MPFGLRDVNLHDLRWAVLAGAGICVLLGAAPAMWLSQLLRLDVP